MEYGGGLQPPPWEARLDPLLRVVEESLAADRNHTEELPGGLLLSRRWAKGPG